MPTRAERVRGVRYYRTKKLPGGKYIHIAIVRRAGKRGGHTIGGRVRTRRR